MSCRSRRGTGLVIGMLGLACFVTARAGTPAPEPQVVARLGNVSLPGKNYVKDGSFENGGQGWSWFVHRAGGLDDKVVYRGKYSFRMGAYDASRHFYFHQYDVPLETGKTYTFSAMVKTKDLSEERRSQGVLFLTDYGWTGRSVSLQPPRRTMDWTRVSRTFVAPPTRLRPDGKPSYTLTVYWTPKNQGQVWLDEIQIEEGTTATEFSEVYVGDGLMARDRLKDLARQILATREGLGHFARGPLMGRLSEELDRILGEAGAIHDDLNRLASLARPAREELVPRVEAVAAKLARMRTVIWTGPAHIPLAEVRLPEALPVDVSIELSCLKGEHRDIALNIANASPSGYPGRLAISELYNETVALRVPPLEWMRAYSVPRMRGYRKRNEIFTDVLPELDSAGSIQVEPASISQVIVSVDTSNLPPGDYTGSVAISSLVDAADHREIPVKLKVLPAALLPLRDVDIVECYGHTDYAWDALIRLGVNTFDIQTFVDVDFNDEGSIKRIDFTHADRDIRRILAAVPDARFIILGGQEMFSTIQLRMGWKPEEKRFSTAFREWLRCVVRHLCSFGVGPSRLIIQPYDEAGPGDYPRVKRLVQWIREATPAVRIQCYLTGIRREGDWKQNALLHDILTPAVNACTPENMAFVKTLGKTLWCYDCAADAETFHPIAYYRVVPWMCRKYGMAGWTHFSWFNTEHGRPYRAWDGVEAQNLVYPALDGKGAVISRRYLALRAGIEDYQVLDTLERVSSGTGPEPGMAARVKAFVTKAYDQALALSPRETGYQSHVAAGLPADLLDRVRQEAVSLAGSLLPASGELETRLANGDGKTILKASVPGRGELFVRYISDGAYPWRSCQRPVQGGNVDVPLEDSGPVNRCLVEFMDDRGRLRTGSPLIIPGIRVDSVSAPYSPRPLNDGIRVATAGFEPAWVWISAPTAVTHRVELDLHHSRRICRARLYWMTYTGLPQKTQIQYANAAGNWQPVSATSAWRAATKAVEELEFAPVVTSKVRVLMAPGGGGMGGPNLMGLSEVEVE